MASVVDAVMCSPAWPRTLLVWLYDEHGGYYDHVPPPAAVPPDDIAPDLSASNQPGTYGMYGVRVPVVVVSPYAMPGAVTDVVHDHTSVLATIEQQWNLPALTARDQRRHAGRLPRPVRHDLRRAADAGRAGQPAPRAALGLPGRAGPTGTGGHGAGLRF